MGGYEHVVVSRNVKVVDGDAVDILQNLPRGTHNGDCIQDLSKLRHYLHLVTCTSLVFIW